MTTHALTVSAVSLGLVAGCGGGSSGGVADRGMMHSMTMEGGGEAAAAETFGPLGVGSDWQTYEQMNAASVRSQDHGGRFVDTYVNAVGAAAYKDDDAAIPVGTIVVKTSWQPRDGEPSEVAGPIFAMEKREPGYDPEHEDWYYAIHWAEIPPEWKDRVPQPIYWQSPSQRVDYCWECHEGWDRHLGGVPEDKRAY